MSFEEETNSLKIYENIIRFKDKYMIYPYIMMCDATDKTNEIIEFYLGMGKDFFRKDFRLSFTKSLGKITWFNNEYRSMFFGFYEQIAEDNVDDATNHTEYDDLLVNEMNKINAFHMVVPKITIVLYTDEECRYYLDGCNTIITHKFGLTGTESMWI